MRTIIAIFATVVFSLTAPRVKADAAPPLPLMLLLPSLSLEGLVSVEPPLTSHLSFLVWGGMAGIWTIGTDIALAEPEVALEGRVYFTKDQHRGWNFGVYVGSAYIINHHYVTLTPGIKIAWKYQDRELQFLVVEPYFSLSAPFYYDLDEKKRDGFFYAMLPAMTFGLRIVFEAYGPAWARSARSARS